MQIAGSNYSAFMNGDTAALRVTASSVQDLYVVNYGLAGWHIISERSMTATWLDFAILQAQELFAFSQRGRGESESE
jgi:hypothetical protein